MVRGHVTALRPEIIGLLKLRQSIRTPGVSSMVLELHIWGPAFGLPSIDAECIATVAYCQRVVPKGQWSLVTSYDTSVAPTGMLPHSFRREC
jgi:hypothetical protein